MKVAVLNLQKRKTKVNKSTASSIFASLFDKSQGVTQGDEV